jgi:localization factor PodJL
VVALAAAADGDEDAGRKRDEVAARLAPADLQAAQALVAAWRPHPARPAANDVAPPPQGWSAAPADHPARRS